MTGPPPALEAKEAEQNQRGADGREGLKEEIHEEGPSPGGSWLRLTIVLAMRALVNPRLAVDLVRMVWAFRARDWYRRPPFLPLPPGAYTRWRMYTAYGSEDAIPPEKDVIRFARWRREVMRL